MQYIVIKKSGIVMLICCFWFQTTKAIQLKDELVEVNGVNVKVNIDFFLFIFYLSL